MKKIKYLSLVAIMLIALTGCGENKEEKQKEIPKNNVVLKEDLKFEINSEVNLLSLLSDNNKVEVISEDEQIDTSVLGNKELIIKYKDNEEEKEHKFTIDIVDTQAPTIEYKKELTTNVGTKIDLLKNVKVSDNSKEEIKATVEGEYDINKEGTYNLKYVAVDSSNNKSEEEFTLKVNKKITSNNNSNTTKPSNNTSSDNETISKEECDKAREEFDKYRGKVFTSIPSKNPHIMWNCCKFYVTKEVKDDGTTTYKLNEEKVSGHYLGNSFKDAILEKLGPLTEMRYTKDNPLILYGTSALVC